MLGYVGEVSPSELKRAAEGGYEPGDKIGKAGVEAKFDEYLRGEAGEAQVRVDSLGRPHGALEPQSQRAARERGAADDRHRPPAGRRAGAPLRHRARAGTNGQWNADGGAIVALDPQDGAVLAMASNPTYKPSVYVGRVDPKKIAPLVDRRGREGGELPGDQPRDEGVYPPGSTLKPVTALAAMQEHLLQPVRALQCTPSADVRPRQAGLQELGPVHQPADDAARGARARRATRTSTSSATTSTSGATAAAAMQEWAEKFGFGVPTGLDVGGEATRTIVPTPAWRKKTFKTRLGSTGPGTRGTRSSSRSARRTSR